MTPEKKSPTLGHRLAHCADGIAAVEFAIVLPVLMTIVFGIIEFGRIMMVEQILATAARNGVREAVLWRPSTSTVDGDSIKNNTIIPTLTAAGISGVNISDIIFSPSNINSVTKISPDPQISVLITVPYSQVRWLSYFSFLNSTNLTGHCTMRKE